LNPSKYDGTSFYLGPWRSESEEDEQDLFVFNDTRGLRKPGRITQVSGVSDDLPTPLHPQVDTGAGDRPSSQWCRRLRRQRVHGPKFHTFPSTKVTCT